MLLGLSCRYSVDQKQSKVLACRAPEQTDSEFGRRGRHTNVWGFATTVLHLATGQLPYHGLTQHQTLTAMIKRRPPTVPDTLSAWLQQLLKQCLQFDTTKRPIVASLLEVSLRHRLYVASNLSTSSSFNTDM